MSDKEAKFNKLHDEMNDSLMALFAKLENVSQQDEIAWTDVAELGYANKQLQELTAFYCQ